MTQIELESAIKEAKTLASVERKNNRLAYEQARAIVEQKFDELKNGRNTYLNKWHEKRSALIDKLHEFKRAGLADFSEEVSAVNSQLSDLKKDKREFLSLWERSLYRLKEERRNCSNKFQSEFEKLSSETKKQIRSMVENYFGEKYTEIPAEVA